MRSPIHRHRSRPLGRFALLSLAALVACPGTSEEKPKTAPKSAADNVCGSVVTQVTANKAASGRAAVVYTHDEDLWLYSVSTDSVSRLKRGLTVGSNVQPEFFDDRSITFSDEREPDAKNVFGQYSLYRLDVRSRGVTEILRLETDILAYGWSPDRTQLAYEVRTFTPRVVEGREVEITTSALCLYDTTAGTTKVIRPLQILPGRGGSESDERSITWSPNGRAILLVDTFQDPSVHVVDTNGLGLVVPRPGTFARWLDDSTIVYREENRLRTDGGKRRGRWFSLDLKTEKAERIGLPAGMSRPEVSPDGTLIALDDADTEDPATYLCDLATGESRLLVRGYGAPIWFSNTLVAVTAGGPCPPRTECNDRWTPLDKTIVIDLTDGSREGLKLPTTGAFFSEIDVAL